jgi:hypothetical protein
MFCNLSMCREEGSMEAYLAEELDDVRWHLPAPPPNEICWWCPSCGDVYRTGTLV